MEVVYVRSHPGSPPDHQQQQNKQNHCRQQQEEHRLSNPNGGDRTAPQSRRSWSVSVRVQGRDRFRTTIQDPFSEDEYESILERYLRDSDRPPWSPQSLSLEDDDGADNLSQIETRIQQYARDLASQLGLETAGLDPSATECQIRVVQHHQDGAEAAGIHCLAWELLEAVHLPQLPKLRLRVTRLSDLPPPPLPREPARSLLSVQTPTQSLSAAQADQGTTFRVLLVVARDFSRRGAERDPEPDLAQWPLMNVQRRLRSRMMLEVVRPGSREELEDHLRVRAEQGLRFHLVHFDLHGRIMPDARGVQVPWLLFAKGHRTAGDISSCQPPRTHLAKAEDVAQLLARHRIGNVVLNACLSAYNRDGPTTNLAHMFLAHGIRNVSAMWFYVRWQTVSTYLDAFYENLLVGNADFHAAAQKGREAIRQQPTSRTGRTYQDYFICVNYARNGHELAAAATTKTMTPQTATSATAREPSPSPSVRSQDSSTSNTSGRSIRSGSRSRWRPSTPRLSDSLLVSDEPVMRMQLHLLELEYKLMTSGVVYASDLRRANSDLNATLERMVSMWLSTNLIDDVCYYKAKDFAKRSRHLTVALSSDTGVAPRERRARGSGSGIGAVRQMLFSRPVRALRQTLHVVRDVDAVVDPGFQADEMDHRRAQERRMLAQEGLQRLARQLRDEEAGVGEGHGRGYGYGRRSYLLLLGSQDAQWWQRHLQDLDGEWWLHRPWSFTVHGRYVREVRLPG